MSAEDDKSLGRAGKWLEEFKRLQMIIEPFHMLQDVKWGWPCYTDGGKNIILIHGFKEYFAVLFFKGTLLTDPEKLLKNIGQNTQSGRQMRFTCLDDVERLNSTLQSYITEAIEIEKAGLHVEYKPTSEFPVPSEFQAQLDESPEFKAAFESLTPGRQRAYLLHFAQPKLSKTREARVEKYRNQILDRKGLND